MKTRFSIILAFGFMVSATYAATINFDGDVVGSPPKGWVATKTGKGDPHWTVEKDDAAPSKPNVLKQSGEATYPICLKDDSKIKDGFVAVKFKALSGKEDQAAGLIWRAKDADNYYVARANALEDNVTVYHTIAGKRTEKKRIEIKVPPMQWQTLRVDFKGNKFTVSLNGKNVLEWEDKTFQDAGKVGLWTKADSVTMFDDFTFGPL
jgi:hypothetical protein